jgi:Tfp pilus assembly protein FimV
MSLELVLVASLTIAIMVVGLVYLSQPAGQVPQSTCTISVDPQQTLWDVAQQYPIEGLSTAQTVDVIRSLNSMSDSSLAVGQTLRVPSASGSMEAAVASR